MTVRLIPSLCTACGGSGKGIEEPGRTTTGGTPCKLCSGTGKVTVTEISHDVVIAPTPAKGVRCPNVGQMCYCTGACLGMGNPSACGWLSSVPYGSVRGATV